MSITEMEQSVAQAKAELCRADIVANSLARLLVGRLRKVDNWLLRDLKRELNGFGLRRGWKQG